MKRLHRSLYLLACAALALAACATTTQSEDARLAAQRFVSDRISVVTRGNGPDIILIHGLGGHRDLWNEVAETLDDRYRLHLVQINGFAGAPAPTSGDSLVAAPVAREIARYIREAGLTLPAVIGHSMGGTIGMMLAARNPGLVGRLMIVDVMPFLGVYFGGPTATPATLRPIADQLRAQALATPFDSSMFAHMLPTMTRVERMRPILLQYGRTSDPRAIANAFHELILTDMRPELASITAPITVLYVIPPNVELTPDQFESAIKLSYSNAPRARFVKIDDANHYLQLDQPARFIGEVDAFMR